MKNVAPKDFSIASATKNLYGTAFQEDALYTTKRETTLFFTIFTSYLPGGLRAKINS